MRIIFSILLVSSLFISCSNQFDREIKEIDRLIVSLDSAKKVLFALDTGIVYKRIKIIEKNIVYIIENNDSATKEQAFIIDDYSLCKKYYGKLSYKFSSLFEEIETLPRQLENLKKDLSKNLIEKDLGPIYLENERIAAESVIKNIGFIADRLESLNDTYIQSNEKILNLIQTIDSNNTESAES